MKFTASSIIMIFSMVILLTVVRQSHQYTYPCDPNAQCGCSSNTVSLTKIVGGESAGTSTWNWAVSISISIPLQGTSLCGGAVLSSSWIITAAHCMAGVLASQVTVYAGSNTRLAGQSRTASNIIVHPSYSSTTKVNDIALIQLSTPLTMSSTVKSICMPSVSSATLSAGEWPAANLYVVAVGWGRLWENGPLPTSIQQVTVRTVDYRVSTCSNVLNNRETQFCAGVSGGGKDTCQGDSGGPLMIYTTSQQWVLVGLTSYGTGCARANYMGVYTRVAVYQSWISTTTGGAYTIATSSNPDTNISFPISSPQTYNSTTSSRTFLIAPIFYFLSFLFSLIFSKFFSE